MIDIILKEIGRLIDVNKRTIIAIDGRSGAGKSTLAGQLSKKYDCNLFHMDDFFLPAILRTEERLRQAGGNVDYIRFKNDIMDKLIKGHPFSYQIFDCKVQDLTEERIVYPKKVNIVEGSYSMHPSLIKDYDFKIFLDIDDETQRQRILKRNGKTMYEKFVNEWIPLEDRYFSEFSIRDKSDIVIK